MTRRAFDYSRWDGTQVGFNLDADSLLAEMADDLTYHGDPNAALRRLLQQGMRDSNGEQMMGLREMMKRLRERRRDEVESKDLGGPFAEIAERLREVLNEERAGIERRVEAARESQDQRRKEIVEELSAERNFELDMMPPDLGGLVKALQEYDFMDDAARAKFEELMDEIRSELIKSNFNQLSEGMSNVSPEQMVRMKDMLADLNQMLEARGRGEEPDFDAFMEKYSDFFPGNPATLDELLEQMARSMAAMQQMLNSMTPEQRDQLQQLSEALLDDVDLRWQMDELGRNLQNAFPDMGWQQSMGGQGDQPMGLGQMSEMLQNLGDLDQLESMLQNASTPAQLAEVDLDRARELLGDDAARSLEQMREMTRILQEAGLIDQREGRLELTPRAVRALGQKALGDLYRKLLKDQAGRHEVEQVGAGHERAYEHKPYEYGDPFNLNVEQTIRNAVFRAGAGTPVRLLPEDFEVERTEVLTRSATVLLLDVSMSMPMRDNFLPAKKVAMALHALITSQFPRDHFGLVAFGRVARDIKPELLPELSWDFEWGTNMQHALMLARRQLAGESGTKQILMVTDGEPTAHIEDGEAYFQYPASPVTVEETLREAARCTKAGITINTFMLDADWGLRNFVEQLTRLNRGRAFFTSPDNLGDYVLLDFLEQRRVRRTG